MARTPLLILDGGLGTSLEDKYGVKFSQETPLWSSHPLVDGSRDVLLACQADFGRVPVDILLTATYQFSINAFAQSKTAQHPHGIERASIPAFLEDAVTIAERAKEPAANIALSLGPYGASMVPSQEYSGKYDSEHDSEESLYQYHLDRLQTFAQVEGLPERAAYVALETVPRVDEIRAIRRLFDRPTASSESLVHRLPGKYWISCVFPQENKLPDGSTIPQVIEACFDPTISASTPWAIGINCTKLDKLEGIVQEYEAAVASMIENQRIQQWPALALYPDGTNGEVYNTETKVWEAPSNQDTPTEPWASRFASIVTRIRARQCWSTLIVGGCCKASCEDIKLLRQHLEDSM